MYKLELINPLNQEIYFSEEMSSIREFQVKYANEFSKNTFYDLKEGRLLKLNKFMKIEKIQHLENNDFNL